MEIKAIDIGPLKFCVVTAGNDGVCSICQQPILIGKLGVVNEDVNAICCWSCIGQGIEQSVAKQTRPLVVI